MDIINLIISLVSGAIGGNLAGAALKEVNLGPVGNALMGIVGGGIGAGILQTWGIAPTGGELDVGAVLGSIASGGVGGGLIMFLLQLLRSAFARA
jgi:uncharacterized membrane protein YeaQ/YmgE (transglycosylase-associated protein family)